MWSGGRMQTWSGQGERGSEGMEGRAAALAAGLVRPAVLMPPRGLLSEEAPGPFGPFRRGKEWAYILSAALWGIGWELPCGTGFNERRSYPCAALPGCLLGRAAPVTLCAPLRLTTATTQTSGLVARYAGSSLLPALGALFESLFVEQPVTLGTDHYSLLLVPP